MQAAGKSKVNKTVVDLPISNSNVSYMYMLSMYTGLRKQKACNFLEVSKYQKKA